MKRGLLFLTIIGIFFTSFTFSQCIPDVNLTVPGVYPDSNNLIAQGNVGMPYAQVIQIRTPLDTVVLQTPVTVDSITLLSFSGFPPGLAYSCVPASCSFPGGTNGCILISGTPTQAGTFPIAGITRAMGHITNTSFAIPPQYDTITKYSITINPPNSLANHGNFKFDVMQNEPNPFNTITNIVYTVPVETVVWFKVYNLIGKEIYRRGIQASGGKNTLRVEADDFAPGVYMYALSNGSQTITKRMIVSKK